MEHIGNEVFDDGLEGLGEIDDDFARPQSDPLAQQCRAKSSQYSPGTDGTTGSCDDGPVWNCGITRIKPRFTIPSVKEPNGAARRQ